MCVIRLLSLHASVLFKAQTYRDGPMKIFFKFLLSSKSGFIQIIFIQILCQKINLFFDEENLIDIQKDFPIMCIQKKKF